MEKITIPQALASALHDYLLTRPMGEVEGLVMALRQSRHNQQNAAHPHSPASDATGAVATHMEA